MFIFLSNLTIKSTIPYLHRYFNQTNFNNFIIFIINTLFYIIITYLLI